MAGLRESRPSPPRGGKHKDLSPIIGAIAMGMGGSGAATGADAGAEDLEAGEGASYGNRASAPTAPQPDYSKLLTKPGFGLNLLSRGGASSAYSSAVAGLAGQQMQGQNALDQIAAKASEGRTTAEQAGGIEKDRMITDAALKLASAHGVPITSDEDLQAFKQAISQPATALAQSKIQGEQLSQNLTNIALQNPSAQPNANAGVNASLSAPFFKNQQVSKMTLNPMEAGFQQGSVDTKPTTGLGTFPGATSVSDRYAKDPATGYPVKTTTSTPSFGSPSFNFDNSNAPSGGINLSELAGKLKAGESEGQDDFDSTPLPTTTQVQAKPSSPPSLSQQAHPAPGIADQIAAFIKAMTAKSNATQQPSGLPPFMGY